MVRAIIPHHAAWRGRSFSTPVAAAARHSWRGPAVSVMFVARSVLATHPPAAAEACASTRAGDSKTAQCSSWCGPAHCGSWCKCRACPTCTSPPPPPPPRSPAPPPPPRTCTSKVAGDASVEGCASWCREKESAAPKRVRRCWHSARPALWRPPKERLSQLGSGAASFTRRFTASAASASRAASARAKRSSRCRLRLPSSCQFRSPARRLSCRPFCLPIRTLAHRSATATLRSGRAKASASPQTAAPSVRRSGARTSLGLEL